MAKSTIKTGFILGTTCGVLGELSTAGILLDTHRGKRMSGWKST